MDSCSSYIRLKFRVLNNTGEIFNCFPLKVSKVCSASCCRSREAHRPVWPEARQQTVAEAARCRYNRVVDGDHRAPARSAAAHGTLGPRGSRRAPQPKVLTDGIVPRRQAVAVSRAHPPLQRLEAAPQRLGRTRRLGGLRARRRAAAHRLAAAWCARRRRRRRRQRRLACCSRRLLPAAPTARLPQAPLAIAAAGGCCLPLPAAAAALRPKGGAADGA